MKLRMFHKTFESANIITASAGTNCPQGGDTGHGGRTVFRLTNEASTAMAIRVNGGKLIQDVDQVELLFGGDCEHETLIAALEFALDVLRGKTGEAEAHTVEDHDFEYR